jgi:hypothetical protein
MACLSKPTLPQAILNEMRRLLTYSLELRSPSATTRAKAAAQFQKSANLLDRSEKATKAASHIHPRFITTSPPHHRLDHPPPAAATGSDFARQRTFFYTAHREARLPS